jgi:DNA-binding PadR family transcriptional regulator
VISIRDHIKGGALTETTFLVLLAVYKPNHGYGMMQFIEQATHGRVVLGAGTLYGAIQTLVAKKWITPVGGDGHANRKDYRITEAGRKAAEEELKRLEEVRSLASTIIGGGLE